MKKLLGLLFILMCLANVIAISKAETVMTNEPEQSKTATQSSTASNIPPLNEENLIANFKMRLKEQLADTPAAAGIGPINPTITVKDKKYVQVGSMGFYVVALKVDGLPPPPTTPNGDRKPLSFDMSVNVDPNAEYQISDIQPLSTKKSMFSAAQREMNKVSIPKDLGYSFMTGTGKHPVLFIADPICPFCREEYKYFIKNSASISDLKLLSLPLANLHPNAPIICAFLEYVHEKFPNLYAQAVETAFTEPFDINSAALEKEIAKSVQPGPITKDSVTGQKMLTDLERATLKILVDKFPATMKNVDFDTLYYLLKGKYAPQVDEIAARLNVALKVMATPVTVIGDGYVVRGRDNNALNDLLGVKPGADNSNTKAVSEAHKPTNDKSSTAGKADQKEKGKK